MKQKKFYFNWFNYLVIIVVVLGILFRFTNLEKKVYWIDEVHTSLRASGYSRTEFVEQAPQNSIVTISELQKFQQLNPERNFWAGVKAIASSEHSPLYYVLARIGMELFGSSINVTRGVAAVISLLSFPCIYWLCRELFADRLVGLIALALVAVSPFHLIYAQEAREYSLLAVTILLSSAALLWTIKRNNLGSWIVYGLTVTLGLYAHPLAVLASIGQGIYVAKLVEFKWHKLIKSYLYASGLGILLFSPWIGVFIFNDDGVGQWTERDIPLGVWGQRWLLNLSSIVFDLQSGYRARFFDVEAAKDIQLSWTNPVTYLIIPILVLIIYSIYFLVRSAPKQPQIFILLLIGVTAFGLGLPDLIAGGQRATVGRYITAVYLGIQIAIAYCLATKITEVKSSWQSRKIWQIITVAVISLGVICSVLYLQANTWWNKYSSYYNCQVAQIINQSPNPLVIGNTERISRVTSLSYCLKPETKIMLVDTEAKLSMPQGFSDVFLFRPYDELLAANQNNSEVQFESVYPIGYLWQLQNN
jgi:uncharacterized membrane protein